jgi:hypothetical protein
LFGFLVVALYTLDFPLRAQDHANALVQAVGFYVKNALGAVNSGAAGLFLQNHLLVDMSAGNGTLIYDYQLVMPD